MTRKSKPVKNMYLDTLVKLEPKTQTQAEVIFDFKDGKHLLLTGYAGTGKTYLAIAMGLEAIKRGYFKRLAVFRSAVATRNQGFLPGTEQDKMAVYEKALYQTFDKLLPIANPYQGLKELGLVNFCSTSFERGVTYDDTVIVVDECQNLTFEEINTLVTRVADTSRIILCGDVLQTDERNSGFKKAMKIIDQMDDHFSHHIFGIDDIVRGGLVRDWIIEVEKTNQKSVVDQVQN